MKFAAALALALFATAANAQDVREWSVETPKGADAWLRYGLHGADGQSISFTCAPKSGQVKIAVDIARKLAVRMVGDAWVDRAGLREPWPASVSLTSGAASATLRGQARANQVADGSLVTAEFSTAAPVAAAFRKTGLIQATAAGETVDPPPAPKSMVRKFLGVCK